MAAIITKRIDELVKLYIAPALKSHGFKKYGQRFTRQEGTFTQVVEVKRWKYNSADHGKLSLDLGVYFPEWDQLLRSFPISESWDPIPAVPATWCCDVRERLDALCREQLNSEWWWEVKPSADISSVGTDLVQAFEDKGMPWLTHKSIFRNAVSELTEFSEHYYGTWIKKISCMLGWVLLNDLVKARQLYNMAIGDEQSGIYRTSAIFGPWLENAEREGRQ